MKIRLMNSCYCRGAVVFLFLGLSAVLATAVEFPLYGEAAQLYSNSVPYDLTQETYTTSELWRVPVKDNQNFIPDSYHSPIATRGDSTYVVFVDPDRRPKVAKITGGSVVESFIDPVLYQPDEFYYNHDGIATNDLTAPDYYRFRDDGHHTMAVGIDEFGYIHVVGDMHNYPWIPAHNHMPLRYVGKYCMYWVSDKPYDVSSFSYLGDRHDECPQGRGFTYNIFFNDMHGQLYFGSRVQQDDAKRAAGCSRYDAGNGTWSAVGGIPSGEQNERLFYEDNAEFGTSSYSKTRPFGVFDRQNNLHISAPILNSNDDLTGGHVNTDICYLKSTDGGTTFTKADGTSVAVPARVDYDPDPNIGQADIIVNGLFGSEGSCAVDYQNNPYSCVKYHADMGGGEHVFGWNGTNWVNYGEIGNGADNRLIHGPSGVLNQIPDGRNRFYRFWHPSETPHQVNLPWPLRVIDYEYLKQTGNLMAITREVNGNDVELVVVKVEINNRPGMAVITPPNRTPAAVNRSVPAGINVPVAFELVGSDIDGDALTYTVATVPANGTLIGTAPNLTYTSNVDFIGTDTLTFTVSDGAATSTPATVSIEVGAWDELSFDNMDQGWIHWVSGGADAVLSENYAIGKQCINLQDNSGDASSVWLVRSLDLTGYTEARVEFTYLPKSMETGEDFWLQYSDNGGSSWATIKAYVSGTDFSDLVREYGDVVITDALYNFTTSSMFRFQCDASGTADDIYLDEIRISARSVPTAPANNAPVANAQSTNVLEDASAGIMLTGSDSDGDSLTYAVETSPTHGTLSGSAPNLTYMPDTNYFGVDSFVFTVSDGMATSATATVSVTVNSVNDLPVFSTDPIVGNSATQGVAYAGSIAATDVEGDSLEYSITGAPAWLVVATNGVLSGTPTQGDGGHLNRFTVEVDDGHGGITNATLEIQVVSIDTDGDGLTDALEIALGTDPDDPDSGFGIDGLPLPTIGKIQLTWPSATGVFYSVWESPDLTNWVVARDWAAAQTPPEDALEIDLSASNGFFKVEAEIQ